MQTGKRKSTGDADALSTKETERNVPRKRQANSKDRRTNEKAISQRRRIYLVFISKAKIAVAFSSMVHAMTYVRDERLPKEDVQR